MIQNCFTAWWQLWFIVVNFILFYLYYVVCIYHIGSEDKCSYVNLLKRHKVLTRLYKWIKYYFYFFTLKLTFRHYLTPSSELRMSRLFSVNCHFRGNELADGEETCQNWLTGSTTRCHGSYICPCSCEFQSPPWSIWSCCQIRLILSSEEGVRWRRNVNFKLKRLEIVFNPFIMSIVQPTSLFKILTRLFRHY